MIIGGFLNFRPRSVTMQTQRGRRNKMEPAAAPAQVASGQRQVGDWEILCGTPASSRSHWRIVWLAQTLGNNAEVETQGRIGYSNILN